ncbi:hypothetical protein U1Q18_002423, partial [Sarracenia purpurea var. burkii]
MTLVVEEFVHVVFDESNHASPKEFSEEDLQNLEKGYQDIFIKENLEPNHEETSTSQQPAVAQPENAESAENSAFSKKW